VNSNTAQRRLRIDVGLTLVLHVIAQAFCPSLIIAWILGCLGLLLTTVRWHRYKPTKPNLVMLPTFRLMAVSRVWCSR
jgi:Flp pilus assembly protein TadB